MDPDLDSDDFQNLNTSLSADAAVIQFSWRSVQ